jgi:3'(2'), 5'-bisphosphate nucleotidase
VNTEDDHQLAARIARESGRMLMELRARRDLAADGELGREGDRRSHELITAALRRARPDDAVRSEEAASDEPGPDAGTRRVWIVDPLDGTREYREGRVDFAVHVALVVAGRAVVGAIALPGENLIYATGDRAGGGASGWRGAPWPGRDDEPLRIAVSRTRPPREAERLARRLGAQLVPMGSAGAKTVAVLRGTADAYVHAGGQYEWDSAAPVAVAEAHGAYVARLDGSTPVYDQPDPWMPDLVVCRPDLRDTIVDALGS